MHVVQDAVIGKHEDVQKLLAKHGGKPFKELSVNLKATKAQAEDDRRAAITDILHFASTGDIRRMQVLCDAHSIKVGLELNRTQVSRADACSSCGKHNVLQRAAAIYGGPNS